MPGDRDLESIQQARDLVAAAHEAQKKLATFPQEKIDAICEAMSQAALLDVLRLGELAVQETGFGIAADKAIKNLFVARDVHNYFRSLKTVGIIREMNSIIEIASPRGVVAAIIPSTNPTSTAIFKCLIAIKSGNSVVLSPHPSATNCINETVRVVREAAEAAGLPRGAIGCMSVATLEGTQELMKHKLTAVILATGGIGLVRAAYSSGKPAFGVGPGNVPAFVERTADVKKAVRDILTGKCFDNGTICSSEQAIVADAPIDKAIRRELEEQGAYFLTSDQAEKLGRVVVTPAGSLNPKIVGKSAARLAEMAGISIPPGVRALVAEVAGVGREYPLSIEKLSPILAYYVVNGVEEGSKLCYDILRYGGMGHTASIHSRNRDAVRQFGLMIPASRVVVNTPSTHGAIGFSTDLPPSMTLGCGSWGGNVTSDNISPIHLMDIKRVAFETREVIPEAVQALVASSVSPLPPPPPQPQPMGPRLDRESIAALVDKFLAERAKSSPPAQPVAPLPPPPLPPPQVIEARQEKAAEPPKSASPATMANGHRPVDFVCEEDVRQAIARGEKIYINSKTIITPAARDIGEKSEVFARP